MKKQEHHYIPQVTIKRFTGNNGKVWYSKRLEDGTFHAPVEKSPKSVFHEKNLYTIEKSEVENNDLEKHYAKNVEPFLKRLYENVDKLTPGTNELLTPQNNNMELYFAVLFDTIQRSPSALSYVGAFMKKLYPHDKDINKVINNAKNKIRLHDNYLYQDYIKKLLGLCRTTILNEERTRYKVPLILGDKHVHAEILEDDSGIGAIHILWILTPHIIFRTQDIRISNRVINQPFADEIWRQFDINFYIHRLNIETMRKSKRIVSNSKDYLDFLVSKFHVEYLDEDSIFSKSIIDLSTEDMTKDKLDAMVEWGIISQQQKKHFRCADSRWREDTEKFKAKYANNI